MGLKPDKWAELKDLQRSNRRRDTLGVGAYVDQKLIARGMQPRFTDQARSRKAARKAREKGK